MEPIAVIDFETTGMSPGHSCRATEIAAVIVEDGRLVLAHGGDAEGERNSNSPMLPRRPHHVGDDES